MERISFITDKQQAREIIAGESPDYTVIQRRLEGHSRWSLQYNIIIQRVSDGKFFSSDYSEGATESQDERPYEWGEPEFTEVFPVQKTHTVYE